MTQQNPNQPRQSQQDEQQQDVHDDTTRKQPGSERGRASERGDPSRGGDDSGSGSSDRGDGEQDMRDDVGGGSRSSGRSSDQR